MKSTILVVFICCVFLINAGPNNNCSNTKSGTSQCSGHGTCTNNTCKCFENDAGRYYGDYCENYELKQHDIECNEHGRLVNGSCVCEAKYFGRYCECSSDWVTPQDNCKPDNSTSLVCSGRGSCICGVCECIIRPDPDQMIYGRYCECDNFSCDYGNGLVCSGHGTCVCGQCICNYEWSGTSCTCTSNTDTCYSPFGNNQEICSGHGTCVCGACQCVENKDGRYTGAYCEVGPENLS